MTFNAERPGKVQTHDDSDEKPFEMFGNTSRRRMGTLRQRPGQRLFKLRRSSSDMGHAARSRE